MIWFLTGRRFPRKNRLSLRAGARFPRRLALWLKTDRSSPRFELADLPGIAVTSLMARYGFEQPPLNAAKGRNIADVFCEGRNRAGGNLPGCGGIARLERPKHLVVFNARAHRLEPDGAADRQMFAVGVDNEGVAGRQKLCVVVDHRLRVELWFWRPIVPTPVQESRESIPEIDPLEKPYLD